MKTYLIEKSVFLNNKDKLDALVFWREVNGSIWVRIACPVKGLTPFLEDLAYAII